MTPRYDRELAHRAARFAALPGVRVRDACERFGVSRHAIDKAADELGLSARPSARDLVLAAVTDYGDAPEGELPELSTIASYVDYVEKNGATTIEVERWIDELVEAGVLQLDGRRYRLVGEFP